MTIEVRYHSRTGNTEKLAHAIAEELGLKAEPVTTPLSQKVDILFLGSAVHMAGVDKEVKDFLRDNKDKIGVLYNFSTAAILSSTYSRVKKCATDNGIAVAEQEFHCRGKWLMMHKGHPDEEDLENAKLFAQEALKSADAYFV